jgi:hypothetical protein
LSGCWPKDKSTGQIIDNESDPRFDRHVNKLRGMQDTTFLGFEVVTGTWKFRVEHFSRYGLLDDSDEDEEPGPQDKSDKSDQSEPDQEDDQEIGQDTFMKQEGAWELVAESETEDSNQSQSEDSNQSQEEYETETGSDAMSELESITDAETENESEMEVVPISTPIGSLMTTDELMKTAHSVQTIKATLFPPTSPSKLFKPKSVATFEYHPEIEEQNRQDILPRSTFGTSIGMATKYVKTHSMKIQSIVPGILPMNESQIARKTNLYVDASHYMSRSFRCGFTVDSVIKLK